MRRTERELRKTALEYLDIVGLADRPHDRADSLPYGLQRKLEIARALALQPKLLLLDEPAAGMNPEESLALAELIRQIRDRFELSVLLIEHHMDVVMELCDHIVVINFGEWLAEGTPDAIQNNKAVLEAYLGEGLRTCLRSGISTSSTARSTPSGTSPLEVRKGHIVSMVGANGAGKSTLMMTIARILKQRSGTILVEGQPLPSEPSEVLGHGVCLVPERRRLYANLTVRENPDHGCLPAPGQAGHCPGHGEDVRPLPDPAHPGQAVCRDPVRRRAADAGHRPRPHGPAEVSAPGRTVLGDWRRWSSRRCSKRSSRFARRA